MVGKKKKIVVGEDGDIVGDLNRLVGGGVCLLGQGENIKVKEFVSSGATLLDIVLANKFPGGFPTSSLIEIYGPYSSGKSLTAYSILANAQKQGWIACLADSERSVELNFLSRIGISLQELIYYPPQSLESALKFIEGIIEMSLATKKKAVVVLDSVAASVPQAEIAEPNYDPQASVALKARILSKNLPVLISKLEKASVIVIFTNQERTKIGAKFFEDNTVRPGGRAIEFYSNILLRLSKGAVIKDETTKTAIGLICRAKVEKSRISPPFRIIEYPLYFSHGIDDGKSIYNVLLEWGDIKKMQGFRGMDYKGEEIKFRESEWEGKMENKEFNDHVKALVAKRLVITYDK